MDKTQRRNLYIGIFIIFLMVSSTAGFIIGDDSGSRKVKSLDKEFIDQGEVWLLEEPNGEYYFRYLPEEVPGYEEIELGDSLYFEAGELSSIQINRVSYFFAINDIKFQFIDELNCSDDTQTLIVRSGINNIYKDDNCLFLEGDIEQSIDKIGYSLVF